MAQSKQEILDKLERSAKRVQQVRGAAERLKVGEIAREPAPLASAASELVAGRSPLVQTKR